MACRTAALALLACLLCAGTARADRKEDAHAAADRGDRAFGKGAFEQALTEYQASYDKYPKPFLLFRLGECHRNLGHDAEALAAYQKYLAKVTHGPDRRKAEAYAAELDKKLAAQKAAEAEPPPEPPRPVVQSTDVEAPPLDSKQIEAQDRERRSRRHKKGEKPTGPPPETTATAPKEDKPPPGWDPDAPPPDPTPVFAESEPPRGPVPVYKKWWLWTIVGGVVVVGVGVTVGLVFGLPKFESELPIGGPGASALSVRPQALRSLTVRF